VWFCLHIPSSETRNTIYFSKSTKSCVVVVAVVVVMMPHKLIRNTDNCDAPHDTKHAHFTPAGPFRHPKTPSAVQQHVTCRHQSQAGNNSRTGRITSSCNSSKRGSARLHPPPPPLPNNFQQTILTNYQTQITRRGLFFFCEKVSIKYHQEGRNLRLYKRISVGLKHYTSSCFSLPI
jgi:hypothetical protein